MLINKNKNFCYRICHIDNLPHILKHGLCTKNHAKASKTFVGIGNPDIIDLRDTTQVKLDGYGNIGEYIPFYFTPKSMMLYNIITGYRAPLVPRRDKQEIIVIRCLISELCTLDQFFFTDGQANVISMTEHYNEITSLDQIDWDIIQKSDFKKESTDTDKQRRYQAEFLVYSHVPVNYIESINVFNDKVANLVKQQLAKTGLMTPVNVIPQYFF